jgi:hypothetical protein
MCLTKLLIENNPESRETDYQFYEKVQTDCNNSLVAVQWLK